MGVMQIKMKMKHCHADTMIQRFFNSCFIITNDHNDFVEASLKKKIACMFDVTVEQLKQKAKWKMVSIGKRIEGKIIKA